MPRPVSRHLRLDPSRELRQMRRMLVVNGDIFIRTLALIFSFAWFTAESAKLGDTLLAANTVLMHFNTLMAYGLDGFAHAAEAKVGGAIGARRRADLRAAVVTPHPGGESAVG